MGSRTIIVIVLFLLFFPTRVFAATYYVATNGNDANAGTLAQPFLTVQKGLNAISQAGDILYIRGGTYSVGETVIANKTGSSSQNIVISGYQNERPLLDATGKVNPTGSGESDYLYAQFFRISNSKYLILKNLELANSKGRGIYIGSGSSDITIDNVWVHNITLAGLWSDEVSNLTIQNSKFWQTNRINDSTNKPYRSGPSWMGAIHPRGSPSSTGAYANNVIIRKNEIFESYGECINAHGRVSNLIIEDNTIYNCFAPAIYYTNDRDVLIQRNLVYQTNDPRFFRGGNPGACIGAQKEGPPTRPGVMKNITIINNVVKGCGSNIFFWGYDGGYLENALIAHNTFIDAHSNTGSGGNNVNIGSGPHVNVRFENNIIIQNDTSGKIGQADTKVVFSNNAWSKAPPSNMSGSGDVVGGLSIARTGNTGAGQLTADYFRIPGESPIINKAKASTVTTDYFGSTRGASPDIGAHEYTGPIAIGNTSTPTLTPIFKLGDADEDGDIDGVDYVKWVNNYSKLIWGHMYGDFNNNGKVDGVDYVLWVNNYGK